MSRRARRAVIVLVLVAVLLGLLTLADREAESAPLSDRDRIAIEAVAELATFRVSGANCDGVIRGTGFVADQRLLTNRHLVATSESIQVANNSRVQSLGVDYRSAQADVAVSRFARNGTQLVLAEDDPAIGTPVLVAGHPGGGTLRFVESTVHLYGRGATWGVSGEVMLLDTTTNGGFSGGPVLDRDGQVVGMLQAVDQATGLTLAVPVSELRSVVNLAERFPGVAAATCSEDSK